MGLELHRVHVRSKLPDGREVVTKANPYVRLNAEDGPVIYIQRGVLYGQGGREIKEKDIPQWFHKELEKIDRGYLKSCGMTDTSIDKYINQGKRREQKEQEEKVVLPRTRRKKKV